MKTTILLITLLVSLAAEAATPAEIIDAANKEAEKSRPAAEKARLRLDRLMKRHPEMHLSLPAEGQHSDLEVIPIYTIGLDDLAKFRSTYDPTTILIDAKRALWRTYYPAPGNRGQILSAVEMYKTATGWRTAKLGCADYAALISQILKGTTAKVILVEIAPMGLHYVAFADSSKDLKFCSLDGTYQYDKDNAPDARDVLLSLVPEAKSHTRRPN